MEELNWRSHHQKMAFEINIPGDTLSGYPEGKKTELSVFKTWRLGLFSEISGLTICERVNTLPSG